MNANSGSELVLFSVSELVLFTLCSQSGAEAFILHYTYGQDLRKGGVFTPDACGFWHWHKHAYEQTYPPRNISLPVKCQARTLSTLLFAGFRTDANPNPIRTHDPRGKYVPFAVPAEL